MYPFLNRRLAPVKPPVSIQEGDDNTDKKQISVKGMTKTFLLSKLLDPEAAAIYIKVHQNPISQSKDKQTQQTGNDGKTSSDIK